MKRREFIAAMAVVAPLPNFVLAQPVKPMLSGSNIARVIVTYAAGGPTDVLTRRLAPGLSARSGMQVIVENKPGAAGNIGTQEAARAEPDGHTLVNVAPTVAVNPALYPNATDPQKDLIGVTQLVSLQYVLVARKNLPAKNLKEFIALAKESRTPLTYGTWGAGSHAHLCAALLALKLGVNMIHVPYKGAAPAMQDVIGGQVDFMFDSVATGIPQIKAGNVLGIGMSAKDGLSSFPEIPALAAEVSGFDITGWQGLMAPAQTPEATLVQWQEIFHATLHDPDVVKWLKNVGLEPVGNPPREFQAFVAAEQAKYAEIIRAAGITLN